MKTTQTCYLGMKAVFSVTFLIKLSENYLKNSENANPSELYFGGKKHGFGKYFFTALI